MQNYANHRRMDPAWHYVGLPLTLFAVVVTAANGLGYWDVLRPWAAFAVALVAGLAFFLTRGYAIKNQDRAILAAEAVRHLALTGKPLPAELTSSQVIALRFSSDAEFPALAARAANENLAPKAVKESIKDWRADEERV